jgi:hypothetical protein
MNPPLTYDHVQAALAAARHGGRGALLAGATLDGFWLRDITLHGASLQGANFAHMDSWHDAAQGSAPVPMPHRGVDVRWGVVKLAHWIDTVYLHHRVLRVCCLIADSPWWTGHAHTATRNPGQMGGITQHDPDGER